MRNHVPDKTQPAARPHTSNAGRVPARDSVVRGSAALDAPAHRRRRPPAAAAPARPTLARPAGGTTRPSDRDDSQVDPDHAAPATPIRRSKRAATDFVAQLSRGDFAAAVATFDDTMHAALPADKLPRSGSRCWTAPGGPTAARPAPAASCPGPVPRRPRDDGLRTGEPGRQGGVRRQRASRRVVLRPRRTVERLRAAHVRRPGAVHRARRHRRLGAVGSAGHADRAEWPDTGDARSARANEMPAVVLVHGSGPNDRDESVGGVKPFRDLAWGLASKGVVVLRYDKRTKVYAAADRRPDRRHRERRDRRRRRRRRRAAEHPAGGRPRPGVRAGTQPRRYHDPPHRRAAAVGGGLRHAWPGPRARSRT